MAVKQILVHVSSHILVFRTRVLHTHKTITITHQMSHPASAQSAHEPAVQQQPPSIPEWDRNAPAAAKTETGITTSHAPVPRPTLKERLDGVLPPNRKYLGLRRRYFLIAVLCAFLALLVLIIGLAVGLTNKSHGG